jgi:hypothetical protein
MRVIWTRRFVLTLGLLFVMAAKLVKYFLFNV